MMGWCHVSSLHKCKRIKNSNRGYNHDEGDDDDNDIGYHDGEFSFEIFHNSSWNNDICFKTSFS